MGFCLSGLNIELGPLSTKEGFMAIENCSEQVISICIYNRNAMNLAGMILSPILPIPFQKTNVPITHWMGWWALLSSPSRSFFIIAMELDNWPFPKSKSTCHTDYCNTAFWTQNLVPPSRYMVLESNFFCHCCLDQNLLRILSTYLSNTRVLTKIFNYNTVLNIRW